MTSIETIICLMLLLMAVPDLCRKLGRPALANVCCVVFGLALGPLVKSDVATMVKEAGEVGFLLVLFEVGLEIDLPPLRKLLPSLRFAVLWSLCQYPLVLGLACASGLSLAEGLLAAAAFSLGPLARARATPPAALFRRQMSARAAFSLELVGAIIAAILLGVLAIATAPTVFLR